MSIETSKDKEDSTEAVVDVLILSNDDDEKCPENDSNSKICGRCLGIVYTLVATLLFTLTAFISKQLKVNLLDTLIPRLVIQTIILLFYMKSFKNYSMYRQSTRTELAFLFLNGFSFSTGFLSFFMAYYFLPLADLVTIRYTQIIWTVLIITFLHKEKPSIVVVVAVFMTMTGIILVTQPNFLFHKISNTKLIEYDWTLLRFIHPRVLGIIFALYCSIGMAIGVISNKHLIVTFKTKYSRIMLQFALITLIVLLIQLAIRYYREIEPMQALRRDFLTWSYLAASMSGMLQILVAVMIQKAVKREHPSIFTIVQSSDILFSIGLQNFFTSDHSNALSIFGSVLVLTSLVLISVWKLRMDKRMKAKDQT